jgi:thiol-disulfide isomerase/thioredoxin
MEVKTELSESGLKELQNNITDKEIIVIKFTAPWCGPCQGIKHICEEYETRFNSNVHYYIIDIDETLELYVKLKAVKQVNGIPALLCFYAKERDHWYAPDHSCLGGNKNNVIDFYEKCLKITN